MIFDKDNLNYIFDLVRDVGKEILEIYNRDFEHELKGNKTPITEADLLSNELLLKGLDKFGFSILTEENNFSSDDKIDKLWIVDPLDGTRDFIQKTGDFSIMIAFLEKGSPIFGLVYCPVCDVLYYAIKGRGSFVVENDDEIKISVSDIDDFSEFTMVRSRNYFSDKDRLLSTELNISQFVKMGSAGIKFSKVASSHADICYYNTSKIGIWDCAPAHIILEEAGGDVFDNRGEVPEYDLVGQKMKNGFFGTNGKVDRYDILKLL